MTIRASKNGKHVVFISTAFGKHGFAEGTKIGALEFNPAVHATVEDAVEAAQKLKVELQPIEGQDVLCNVVIL